MQSMANLAAANTGGGSNGSIEKPTLLLYPRKSVVSGSPRDLSQVRSSIHGIAEAVAHTAGFSAPTKTSRESMAGSRASLLMRSLNRGANSGSIAHLAAESRRSMLQIAQDGQVMVTRQQLGASGLPRSHSQNILHHSNQRMSQPPPQQHQPPSQAVQKQLQDAQQSLEPMPVGRRSRPVSIVSLKNLNKIKESLSNLASAAHNEELEQQEQSMPVVEGQQVASNEYYEYLMLTQRHSSSNFIHKVDSTEIAWETKPLPLKMVGAYLLGEKIGKGAFGKVKEGVCSETLKRVAIKIIGRKRLRKVPNGVENMIREIKMLRRLKHPNVVTLVDVFAKVEDQDGNVGIFPWFTTIEEEPIVWLYDDGREEEKDVKVLKWYLILEFCPCSLQVLLEQCDDHKISLAQAHRYFVQLMDGLSYLHSQSIILDVWACGVTLYNMISGRLPFEFDDDGNLLDLYDKIIRGTFEMPAEATPDLADLLRRMLAKDPALRLSVFEIQSHPWTQTVYNMPRKAPYIPTFQQHGPDTPLSPETHRDGASTIESSPAKATTAPRSTDEPGPERHSGASAGEKADAGSNSTPAAAAPPAVDVTAPTTEAAVTPCETTMIPFLNIMYQSEIEADLRETGTVFDGLPDDTIVSDSLLAIYLFA
nr:Serine/threonine-protein kinase stk11 [Polyrhizophydium stewartii]